MLCCGVWNIKCEIALSNIKECLIGQPLLNYPTILPPQRKRIKKCDSSIHTHHTHTPLNTQNPHTSE